MSAQWRSFSPTMVAVFPPIPASTSSNINVGIWSARARMLFMASMTRESSPPEAMRAIGFGDWPGLGEKRYSTRRCRRRSGHTLRVYEQFALRMIAQGVGHLKHRIGHIQFCSSCCTACCRRSAACRRLSDRVMASDLSAWRARPSGRQFTETLTVPFPVPGARVEVSHDTGE